MKIKTPQKSKLPLILLALLAILLLAGSYFTYGYFTKRTWPFVPTTPTASYENDGQTPGTVRTIEDESESQNAKKRAIDKQNNPTTPVSTSSVTISYADVINNNLEVRAFTSSIIEPGTCTFKITKDGNIKKYEKPAFIDAKSTICEPLIVTASSFTSGIWKVEVEMKTETTTGQSAAVEVNIS